MAIFSRRSKSLEETTDVDIFNKETEGMSQGQIVIKRFFRHRGAMVSLIVLFSLITFVFSTLGFKILGVGYGGWWKYKITDLPVLRTAGCSIELPGCPSLSLLPGKGFGLGDHPFGQDDLGRDYFSLVMRGAERSIEVMVVIGLVAGAFGIIIGAIAGFYRGWIDAILMRINDFIITIPIIVLGGVISYHFGNKGILFLAFFLGVLSWGGLSRLVRGEFLTLREREFVDAARVAGASNRRIIFKHILPNAIGVIIVNVTLVMSGAILLESALSYLGLGVVAPDVSLGLLISQYQDSFTTRPWLFWYPGLLIIIIALCVNFIGDGLRDAFDPRQRRRISRRVRNAERQMAVKK
jgi:ABC-type dipeptide/oligopeptide/nickel transport system permease subunit